MAKAERLTPFNDLEMIDSIVTNSKGAYTHNEVFMQSMDFVYKLSLLHYEKNQFHQRFSMYQKEINK